MFAIILIVIIVNAGILGLVYAIVKRIQNRAVQIIIPVMVMLAGYLIMMDATPANLIIGTYFFVVPMAVLIPTHLNYIPADSTTGFTRIFLCDFFLSIIAVTALGYVISSQYLNTIQYYQNLTLSNGMTYACIIIFDIVLAIILFGIMDRKRSRYPVRAGKTGGE
ncbi:MAG: hypothetical protein M0Q92_10215 [Methanoregula sp.]|nr:hypothetical protein [Methanoregula sp.]